MADIRPFDIDDPRIFPKFPGEQTITDIDGVNLCRPRLKEAVGKTARGGAYVKGGKAGDGDAEEVESPPQFETAPADIGIRLAPDPDFRSGGDQSSCLIFRPVVDKDNSREDQRLGLLKAFSQPPFNEEAIQADFFWFHRSHRNICLLGSGQDLTPVSISRAAEAIPSASIP